MKLLSILLLALVLAGCCPVFLRGSAMQVYQTPEKCPACGWNLRQKLDTTWICPTPPSVVDDTVLRWYEMDVEP